MAAITRGTLRSPGGASGSFPARRGLRARLPGLGPWIAVVAQSDDSCDDEERAEDESDGGGDVIELACLAFRRPLGIEHGDAQRDDTADDGVDAAPDEIAGAAAHCPEACEQESESDGRGKEQDQQGEDDDRRFRGGGEQGDGRDERVDNLACAWAIQMTPAARMEVRSRFCPAGTAGCVIARGVA